MLPAAMQPVFNSTFSSAHSLQRMYLLYAEKLPEYFHSGSFLICTELLFNSKILLQFFNIDLSHLA